MRWGAVSQADDRVLQSPFRSGIEVDEYQLDPVIRALSMPRVNLLIADDVGLGKTIEAGLVVQEMILRHRVGTVLRDFPRTMRQIAGAFREYEKARLVTTLRAARQRKKVNAGKCDRRNLA